MSRYKRQPILVEIDLSKVHHHEYKQLPDSFSKENWLTALDI